MSVEEMRAVGRLLAAIEDYMLPIEVTVPLPPGRSLEQALEASADLRKERKGKLHSAILALRELVT